MSSPSEVRRGIVLGVAAYLLWGLLTIYWKVLDHLAATELIGWRLITALGLLVVVLAATGRLSALYAACREPRLRRRLVVAGLLVGSNWSGYVYAVMSDQIIETALGYFMAPLGTMLIGVVVLHEKLRPARWIAVILAVAAVVVLTASYGRVPFIALLLASTWSVYGFLKKTVPLHPLESLTAEVATLALPAGALVVWGMATSRSVFHLGSTLDWLLVLGSGAITIVPLLLFAGAAQRVPLTQLGPLQYSVPTISFLLGWLVYDEPLPASRVAGFALVWTGLLIVAIDAVRRRTRDHRAALAGTPA